MRIEYPARVRAVTDALESRGFSAYLVGGCVRDSLLGKVPHDYDVATNALPGEIKDVFRDFRTVDTGIRHGTVTVVSEGDPVEVTTFRIDGDYADGRHPDRVEFTSDIAEDLSRRDFTVNAMAYSDRTGLVDLFGGKRHLGEKLIVTVGEPDDRFGEDGLRVLRALRFASTLDFTVEDRTAEAVRRSLGLLARVSEERIYSELTKLLAGTGASRIAGSFPGIVAGVTDLDADAVVRAAPLLGAIAPDPTARLALLFTVAGIGADGARERMKKLKSSGSDRDRAAAVCRLAAEPLPRDLPAVRRLTGSAGGDVFRTAAAVRTALGDRDAEASARLSLEAEERGDPTRIRDLAVGGDDVIALGAEGKKVGEILSHLLFLVTEDEIKNDRDVLLAEAKKRL